VTFLPPNNLFWILADVLQVLVLLVLVEVVVSWLIYMGSLSSYKPWVRTLRQLTSPILNPFRKILSPYRTGGLDLSPILAILLIEVIQNVLLRLGSPGG
jgi:YggT family protein